MTIPTPELKDLLAAHRTHICPPMEQREFWQEAALSAYGASVKERAITEANAMLQQPAQLPSLEDTLVYTRTGNRTAWQNKMSLLVSRMSPSVLAACFTGQEQWVNEAAELLWLMCQCATWVYPAHDTSGAKMDEALGQWPRGIDLGAAMRAQEIAETLQLLGSAFDNLDARIGMFAREQLQQRVFAPYLESDLTCPDYWWLSPRGRRLNNWTAVCSGGVLVAGLASLDEQPELQAQIVSKAAWSLGHFLDTFEESGALDEGVGYWSYGFLYYVMAAERLWSRTGGQIDLLADAKWRDVALFPMRINLYANTYPNFSDCSSSVTPAPGWLFWLGQHLQLPEIGDWASRLLAERLENKNTLGPLATSLTAITRDLVWSRNLDSSPTLVSSPTRRPFSTYIPDLQWLVARSDQSDDALILAVKGGHNSENHNHNDGGSFIVHWQQEALIDEIGAPTYTRQFFSPTRYENIAARSLGHSVPYPNQCEQHPGRDYAAQVITQNEHSIELELKGLYGDEAALSSLRRTLTLHRHPENCFITLQDKATFQRENSTLAIPLIVRDCAIKIVEPGHAEIYGQKGALAVTWPAEQAVCHDEVIPTDDPTLTNQNGESRLRYLWFDVATHNQLGILDLTFTPRLYTASGDIA